MVIKASHIQKDMCLHLSPEVDSGFRFSVSCLAVTCLSVQGTGLRRDKTSTDVLNTKPTCAEGHHVPDLASLRLMQTIVLRQ